jgi:hypothetical protein
MTMTLFTKKMIPAAGLALLFLLVSGAFSMALSITYTYDSVGRLLKAEYGGGRVIEYFYDLTGNILTSKVISADKTLRVFILPEEGGSVGGSGIACPNDCVESFAGTPVVTLTPYAASGFQFLGWGVDAGGVTNPLPLIMNNDKNIAVFFGKESQQTDTDGVADTAEMGPSGTNPGYDGDGNGVPDYLEARVASLPTAVGGGYATLAVPEGLSLSNVRAVANPSPADAPTNVLFPYGLFEFTVTGLTPGDCTEVSIYLPPDASLFSYYKYGATPEATQPHWYEFPRSGPLGAAFFHETALTRIGLAVCDSQKGDADLAQDGRIVDPGGPVRLRAVYLPVIIR